MQADRVGRGQGTRPPSGRRDQAEGAKAGGAVTQRHPDLAGEMRHRCLAVGAGHRGDDAGLAAVEARRDQGQAARRVRVGDDDGASAAVLGQRERGGIVGQDRSGALRYGFGREGAPVGLGAAQRGEQKARPHLPGIGGDAGNLAIVELRAARGRGNGRADQLSKIQSAFPAGSRSLTLL